MFALASFFFNNRKFTWVATLGVVIFGLSGLTSLTAETFPSVNIGSVIVTTVYPGASASEVEARVTKPIEEEVRGVRGLKEVRSVSQTGLSRIVIVADIDNYDVDEVISDVQRAIDRTKDLPAELPSKPEFLEVKSDEFPVIELAVIGTNENRLRDKVAYELKEELEDNKGISSVTLTGYTERQFNIFVSREKLERWHVGLDEVRQSLNGQNVNFPAGNLETDQANTTIKVEGKAKSVEELENLVVRANFSGERILLKDVAKVKDEAQDAEYNALYEGQPATLITIAKKGGADIIELSNQVKVSIASVEAKYSGLDFTIFNDEGIRVGKRVGILSSNGLAGLLLVVVFLLIFLPGRVGLMSALSLPLAVFGALGYMNAAGMTLNSITIIALVISLGMLVDNAVVIAENFARLTDEGLSERDAILKTIADLWLPITATALTTIAAFVPMLVTKGIMGQFIKGIPIVVSIALLLSLFEGFFLLPIRLARENREPSPKKSSEPDWFERYLSVPFERIIRKLVFHKYIALGLFMGIIGGSLFMIAVVNKFVLFPADQTEIYVGRVELVETARLENTTAKVQEYSKAIKAALGKDVDHIIAKTGVSENDFGDPQSRRGENVGIFFIFMTPEARDTLKTNDVLDRLRAIKIEDVKDVSFEAQINGPPVGAPVTATFRSNNPANLKAATEYVAGKLAETKGIFDVQIDDVYGSDELALKVDQFQARRLGLDLATIGSNVRIAVAGEALSDVNLENRTVRYFVRMDDADRRSPTDLSSVKISDRSGNLIPLNRVATLESQPATAQIKRYDFKSAKTITANIDSDVITSVAANGAVESLFRNDILKKYPDISLEYGGEGERTQESMDSLAQALILSLVGIFALLVFIFGSYLRPLIILSTIPLGLVGVAVAFFLHGRPISFLAVIGVIGLGGIIVNSGIVLISFIERMRKESTMDLNEILIKSSSLRLKAVIVTSLTTVCGLFPTAYGIGGSDEFIVPLAMAMAWGLSSGTVLTLLWVPCAYAITEDVTQRWGKLVLRIRGRSSKKTVPGEVMT